MADAIVYATAQAEGAGLVTGTGISRAYPA